MFMKYAGAFGKSEAEWAQEVLDLNNGDKGAAESMIGEIMESIKQKRLAHRLYELGARPPQGMWGRIKSLVFGKAPLTAPASYTELEACFVAAVVATHPRCWWLDGLAHLEEIQWKVPMVD